jgi:flap endonuclease-1
MLGFLLQIIKFLSNKIVPIYIFEGTAPEEKRSIINSRYEKKVKIYNKIDELNIKLNESTVIHDKIELINSINKLKKQCISITQTDIDNLKELLDIFGVKYLTAKGESDNLFSYLSNNNYITSCLSEDMDMLANGCKYLIKNKNGYIYEYHLTNILNKLQLTYDKFVQLCVLFGCDYIKPQFKLNTDTIYEIVKESESFDEIIDKIEHINGRKINKSIYEKIILLYKNSDENENVENINFNIITNIKLNDLNYLIDKHKILIDHTKLINNIKVINNLITNMSFINKLS